MNVLGSEPFQRRIKEDCDAKRVTSDPGVSCHLGFGGGGGLWIECLTRSQCCARAICRCIQVQLCAGPVSRFEPNQVYLELNNEDMLPIRTKSQEIAKDIFK